ncbi:MAG TPA: DUF1761 domain-containing protein [Candidatus Paceibacterota bacterium]|nr:DUF1761 domain-containing protein [Candidatus Paceibacterota bacterium]
MMALSIWPLVVAAILAVGLRYAWYHSRVFGGIFMRVSATSPHMIERSASRWYVYRAIEFIAALLLAFVFRELLLALGIFDIIGAVRLALYIAIGFAVPMLLGPVLFEHRPVSLYLINVGYWFLALVAIAVILVL